MVAIDGTFFGDGGPPGDVAPGAWSELGLETDSSCAAYSGGTDGLVYHHATAALPGGGSVDLPGFGLSLACGLHVAAFAWPLPPPVQPPDPIAGLTISIDAPTRAQAGTTVLYTVTLANAGDSPVAFDDCPDYFQSIVGLVPTTKGFWQLNCGAAHSVPARGSELFAMDLAVPGDAHAGPTQLSWLFPAPGRAHATVPIMIVADPHATTTTDPNAPPPCVTAAGGPPCGPGAVPQETYPYGIDNRCGPSEILFDGLWWRSNLPPGPAPYGWGDPTETGTMTLLKPGVYATFQGPHGQTDYTSPAPTPPEGSSCPR